MLENNIIDSVNVLDKFKENNVWSGTASGRYHDALSDLVLELNKNLEDVEKFSEAMELLDEIIKIDEELDSLQKSYVSIPEDADQNTKKQAEIINAGIYDSIDRKKNERFLLRSEVINLLSSLGIIVDMNSLGLDDIDGLELLKGDNYKFDNGQIYVVTVKGVKYEVYIPYILNTSAPIIVYDPGNSSAGAVNSSENWSDYLTYFENTDCNNIVIRSKRKDNSECYNYLVDTLNLNPSTKVFISHSGGTPYSFKEYLQLYDEGDDTPGVMGIMDGHIDNYNVEKLKESETIIFGFHQDRRNSYAKEYEQFAKSGVNMLILSDISEYGSSHGKVNDSLTQNGVTEFLTGNGELPDNYVIKYYNPSDPNADANGYTIVDYDQVKTLDDVYNFFGIER